MDTIEIPDRDDRAFETSDFFEASEYFHNSLPLPAMTEIINNSPRLRKRKHIIIKIGQEMGGGHLAAWFSSQSIVRARRKGRFNAKCGLPFRPSNDLGAQENNQNSKYPDYPNPPVMRLPHATI